MSGGRDVLAHYGAAIDEVVADDQLLFFLIAEIKGKITPHPDRDMWRQIAMRARGQHAFADDADDRAVALECLATLDEEQDDKGMVELMVAWREELYGARLIYLGKRGRRPRAEME